MITWLLGMAFMIGTAIYQLYYFDKYKTISRFKAFFLGFAYFFIIFVSFLLPVFGGEEMGGIGTVIISLAVTCGIFFLIAKLRIAFFDTDYGNEKYVVAFKEILACIGMFFGIFSLIFMLVMALLGNPFERDDFSDD